jgi:hypothetical protein
MNLNPKEMQAAEAVKAAASMFKTLDEDRAKSILTDVFTPLPPDSRRRVLDSVRQEVESEEARIRDQRRVCAAFESFADWWGAPFCLEKNDCSRYHKLQEAARARQIYGWNADDKMEPVPSQEDIASIHAHCFVIRHDWAAAFADTEVSVGDIVAPYEQCVFEFRYSGHTVIGVWEQSDDARCAVIVEFGDIWFAIGAIGMDHPLIGMVRDQIRAVCISLDADVATKELVRAPHKLNEKRIRKGEIPLSDYHIVDLAKRHRIANPSAGGSEPSHHKRLHFVRGHWRHYEDSKTWIKWHLRGNPDLGFIQKHYQL